MNNNLYSKEFFKYFCDKNKEFFNRLNSIEESENILSVSYTSLERYNILHYYLIDNGYIKCNLRLLDLGCYIGLYIYFLNYIGIKEIYGLDYSKKSILFGKKIGINNLYFGDMSCMNNIFTFKFDIISCLHVFEYLFIEKNGKDFIYNTLKNSFDLLNDGGIIFFSIGDGYQKWDKNINKYIHIDGKVEIDIQKILNIGFISYEKIQGEYYIFKK